MGAFAHVEAAPAPAARPDVARRPEGTGAILDDATVRRFVESRYARHFGARIRCTYPHLLCAVDAAGRAVAAVGFRDPDEAFFLEQYLDAPAEDALSALYGRPVARDSIVEIGNLAGDGPAASFLVLQGVLHHLAARREHVLLTCTQRLKRRFGDLPHHRLAVADPARLADDGETWGSYYDERPEVITGRLADYDQRFGRLAGLGRSAGPNAPNAPELRLFEHGIAAGRPVRTPSPAAASRSVPAPGAVAVRRDATPSPEPAELAA